MELGKCVETWTEERAWDVGKIEKAGCSEAVHELRMAKEREPSGSKKEFGFDPRAVAMRSFHLTHFLCLSSALQSVWYVSCGNIY